MIGHTVRWSVCESAAVWNRQTVNVSHWAKTTARCPTKGEVLFVPHLAMLRQLHSFWIYTSELGVIINRPFLWFGRAFQKTKHHRQCSASTTIFGCKAGPHAAQSHRKLFYKQLFQANKNLAMLLAKHLI